MKGMLNYLFIIILIGFISSCSTKRDKPIQEGNLETICFDENYVKELPFSSFVDTIELIPLETTEKNLIGEVNRIVFDDNKYYVRSTNSMQNGKLFVFDKDGKFLQQIGRKGGGPDEYIEMEDFTVTHDNKIVLASYHKLLTFDDNGEFLYATPLGPSFTVKETVSTSENEILAFHSLPILLDNNMLSVIGKNGIESMLFNRGEIEAVRSSFLTCWRSLLSTDSCFYLKYAYCDTIFSISQDLKEFHPIYGIDYGKKKIPNLKVSPKGDALTWEKKLNQLDDFVRFASFGIGDDFVYLGTTGKSYEGYLTLYSPKTKKSVSSRKLVDDMYLKGNVISITPKRIPHNMDGNDILWEIEPVVLLEGFEQFWSGLSDSDRETFKRDYAEWYRICTSLKEDDNPVLMRIKVKNF